MSAGVDSGGGQPGSPCRYHAKKTGVKTGHVQNWNVFVKELSKTHLLVPVGDGGQAPH